jgi:hypothetical protein
LQNSVLRMWRKSAPSWISSSATTRRTRSRTGLGWSPPSAGWTMEYPMSEVCRPLCTAFTIVFYNSVKTDDFLKNQFFLKSGLGRNFACILTVNIHIHTYIHVYIHKL